MDWDWTDLMRMFGGGVEDYDFGGEIGDFSDLAFDPDTSEIMGSFADTPSDYFGGDTFLTDYDFGDAGQLPDYGEYLPDLDLSGSGSGPVSETPFTGSLDTSPISRSLSDRLRSAEGNMTPAEQIGYRGEIDALSGGSNWSDYLKPALQGLGSLLGKGGELGGDALKSLLKGTPNRAGAGAADLLRLPGRSDGGGGGAFRSEGIPGAGVYRQPDSQPVGLPRSERIRGAGYDSAPMGAADVGGGAPPKPAQWFEGRDLMGTPGAWRQPETPIVPGEDFDPIVIPYQPRPMMAPPSPQVLSGLQRLLMERQG